MSAIPSTPYHVDDIDPYYRGLARDQVSAIACEVISISEPLRQIITRVMTTGIAERLPSGWTMHAGDLTVPFDPAICYRSDNPPAADWRLEPK